MSQLFTVLLAEDDPQDRELLRTAALRESIPITLHEVTDGAELIDYLQGNGRFADRSRYPIPDLLVTDLKMPKLDGLQVLKWLRENRKYCQLPTVMLSGSGLRPDIEEAYRRGVNAYFTKPPTFADLRMLIRTIFDFWLKSQLPPSKKS